jgi:hypothetical protein
MLDYCKPMRRPLALAYGAGLLVFEVAEWRWLGPQPLEFAFAGVGVVIGGLSVTCRTLGGWKSTPCQQRSRWGRYPLGTS